MSIIILAIFYQLLDSNEVISVEFSNYMIPDTLPLHSIKQDFPPYYWVVGNMPLSNKNNRFLTKYSKKPYR